MKERERLSSRLGFILLSAGCAIGLGNVWRFPYITGRYGGATFVLIYIIFLLLIGLPVMTMEFAIGRAGRRNIAGALKKLEPEGTKWHTVGPFAVAGNYILLMFYSVITGWLIYYFWSFIRGSLNGSIDVNTYFSALTASPGLQTAMTGIALFIMAATAIAGLKQGVEKVSKLMMAVLFLLMIILAVYCCNLDGGREGLLFFIKPSMSNLVEYGLSEAIFAAMGQAFFTLSLGIGAMAIFGSYIGNERSLSGETIRIMCLDTSIALLSGLIIFPACSAYNVDNGQGPSLIFLSLPEVFIKMPGGRLWGALFFLSMVFAAMTTLIAVFENIVAYWMDERRFTRKKAVILNFILLFILSLPCILGFNVLSSFQPFGEGTGVLDLEDFAVSNLILPLGSLAFVLFCTLKKGWGWNNFTGEADKGKGMKFPKWLKPYCTFILPIIILIVTVNGIYSVFA